MIIRLLLLLLLKVVLMMLLMVMVMVMRGRRSRGRRRVAAAAAECGLVHGVGQRLDQVLAEQVDGVERTLAARARVARGAAAATVRLMTARMMMTAQDGHALLIASGAHLDVRWRAVGLERAIGGGHVASLHDLHRRRTRVAGRCGRRSSRCRTVSHHCGRKHLVCRRQTEIIYTKCN